MTAVLQFLRDHSVLLTVPAGLVALIYLFYKALKQFERGRF